MGLTNFHSAGQLLARAGTQQELQAIIQELHCPVYVNYTSFPQEALEQYSWRLRYSHLDQWASPVEDTFPPATLTKTPDPLKIPKLSIAPVFGPASTRDLSSMLAYIFLIEGNRGANQKLVLQHDHHGAGVTVFHEAMNGFSVVFSGAVSKRALGVFLTEPKRRRGEIVFKKAESIKQFSEEAHREYRPENMEPYEVLILC
ncbi:hypothetical protein EG329_010105 [Mollisiaceae sp. DMI_Dod_QoI]|nr:hypothetical protein EG329_010105 [Helotiales sp. DMI_Dod_QoI]